jgi:hypothetical protein
MVFKFESDFSEERITCGADFLTNGLVRQARVLAHLKGDLSRCKLKRPPRRIRTLVEECSHDYPFGSVWKNG